MNWKSQLELDGQGPLYDQIKRSIVRQIHGNNWRPGERIPSEHDLVRHFSAARMTVNRALRDLVNDGLIVRHRRAGSFVAAPPAPTSVLEIVDMSTMIPKRGQSYAYELLSRLIIPADPEMASRLGIRPGTEVLFLRCRHLADEAVVELEERWINLDVVPHAASADFDHSGPSHWLLNEIAWSEAEHVVSAVNADAELSDMLEIDRGIACLILERRTFLDAEIVTYARLAHPGTRHMLAERFTPASR